MRKNVLDPLTGLSTDAGGIDPDTGQLVDNQPRGLYSGQLKNPTGLERPMGDRDVTTGQPLNNGLRDFYTGQYRHPGLAYYSPYPASFASTY